MRTPKPSVQVRRSDDGVLHLASDLPLPPPAQSLGHMFDETARAYPDRVFMRQRTPAGPWRAIDYAAAQRAADGLAQWLIDHGVGYGDAVAFLSAPSIEHGIAAVGVQRSGAALAPINPSYSLLASDCTRLVQCVRNSGARVVIVDDAENYAGALDALKTLDATFIVVQGVHPRVATIGWQDVIATPPSDQVAARMAGIEPHMIARIMYTSGSTGSPKATPQTHANLTITVAQVESLNLLDFDGEAPQHLESMPFSHIMAGNYNFANVIRTGGTIWIDDGKPTPALFKHTIANLAEVSPHFFVTVPLGYAMLCEAMEADSVLRDCFFRNLRYVGFGGAVLPDPVKDRLLALSRAAKGYEVPILSLFGATEYLFGAMKYWPGGPTDVIGLPLPTTELKLVPIEDRYELRVRGPTLMPRSGYIGTGEACEHLFDEEDFFRTGDAVRLADPDRPERGLVFAGRLADDFKLSSGTFVAADMIRQRLMAACSPLLTDVVICGLNEDYIGALLFAPLTRSRSELVRALYERIAAFNALQTGSSRRIGTALLAREPLSAETGEMTPKGNASPRAVWRLRHTEIARLFADPVDDGVMRFDDMAVPGPVGRATD